MPTKVKFPQIALCIILTISKVISADSKAPLVEVEDRTINISENTVILSSHKYKNTQYHQKINLNVSNYPSTAKFYNSSANGYPTYGKYPTNDDNLPRNLILETVTDSELVVVTNYRNVNIPHTSLKELSPLTLLAGNSKWRIPSDNSLYSVSAVKRNMRKRRDTSQNGAVSVSIEVRKCCSSFQYFSSQVSPPCTSVGENSKFIEHTLNLIANKASNITISAGLAVCDSGLNPKVDFTTSNMSHAILNDGSVLEISSNVTYSGSQYCFGIFGPTYTDSVFIFAYCEAIPTLPKCCPVDKYFDEDVLDCLPLSTLNRLSNNFLDNYHLDNNAYGLKEVVNFPACSSPVSLPIRALADDFVIINGRLCVEDGCYTDTEYCIDYASANGQEVEAIAYYCGRNYFVKCCHPEELLDGTQCVKQSNDSTPFLAQLTKTSGIRVAFSSKQCAEEKSIWLQNDLSALAHWRLGDNSSYIIVESANITREIANYCIDDLDEQEGMLQPIAIVCESDLENFTHTEGSLHRYTRPGSLPKCCPKALGANTIYYYSSIHNACDVLPANGSIGIAEYFIESNFTGEHVHGIPKCSNGQDRYHTYPVNPVVHGVEDYATLTEDGYLTVVSTDGRCVHSEAVISEGDFCVEYMLTAEGRLMPMTFVCSAIDIENVYSERFAFMTVLLALSCIALFYTLISLFTTRVRRGIVSIRKVNTLAGRILVSFVGSHLIGFLALAIGQHENAINRANTSSCFVLAGFIQFFNLATFCWNTSICMESLLLTMNIKIKEWIRYSLHCLWAWGFPLTMTLLMFLMDANRENFSCETIIPSIGVRYCFIFKTGAKMLYFYLPIFMTLTANILFLVGAKALRNYRLKLLEKGMPGGSKFTDPVKDEDGNKPRKRSGMKIHQTLNARAESFRLVLWTGGTWFLELAGFVISRYILPPEGASWFYYLWYIPTTINALRGLGIFAIIVLTPDVKKKWKQKFDTVTNMVRRQLSKVLPIDDGSKKSKRHSDLRERNMTMTTNVTSVDNITDDNF